MGVLELVIIAFICLFLVPVVLLFNLLMRLTGGGASAQERSGEEGEARGIQDLHALLERMEKRIESLETILLDRARKQTGE